MKNSPESGRIRALDGHSRRAHLFEHLPVPCYVCDCAGAITDYNQRVVELWGREPQITDRYTGAHRTLDAQGDPIAPETSTIALLLRTGAAQLNKELVIEQPDGKRITVLSNAAPLLDEGGNMIGALDVLQDITQRRWVEEARRVAERLRASARVATEVAQLKPALLSMASLIDQLGRDTTLSDQGRGYAQLARLELVRFDALVSHMAHLAGAT